jgi:hypothetical protein
MSTDRSTIDAILTDPNVADLFPLFDRFSPLPLNHHRAQYFMNMAAGELAREAHDRGIPLTGVSVVKNDDPLAPELAATEPGQVFVCISNQYQRRDQLSALAEKGRQVAPYAGVALAAMAAYAFVQEGVKRIPPEKKAGIKDTVNRQVAGLRRLIPRRQLTPKHLLRQVADRRDWIKLVGDDGTELIGQLAAVGGHRYEVTFHPDAPPLSFVIEQVTNITYSNNGPNEVPLAVTIKANPDSSEAG